MRHMGNSGKLAIVAAGVSVGLLVLASITLEEAALFAFLAAVGVGYVACISEVFARRRYKIAVLGCVGSSLFVAFAVAFLRMWGLAFNDDGDAPGRTVSTQDSDAYFYLAAAAGAATLFVLFLGAVWPGGRVSGLRQSAGRATARTATRRPATFSAAGTASRPRTAAVGAPKAAGVKKPVGRQNASPVRRATATQRTTAARRAGDTQRKAPGSAAPRTKR